jgi:cell division protease FtsH
VEREVIFAEDVENIFGKRPWTSRADELLEDQMRAEAEQMAAERTKALENKALEEESGKRKEEGE